MLDRLHLPAPEMPWLFGRHTKTRTVEEAMHSCTLNWVSLCGLTGWLYRFAGVVRRERIPFCTVCVARANEQASAEYRARRRQLRLVEAVAA